MATRLRSLLDSPVRFPGWERRAAPALGWDTYQLQIANTWTATVGGHLADTFNSAMTRNPIVYAAWGQRQALFAEARFAFQRLKDGRPGGLWGDSRLRILESPWPRATTADLLGGIEMFITSAGNAFVERVALDRVQLVDPTTVTMLIEEVHAGGPESPVLYRNLVGFDVTPPNRRKGRVVFPEDMAHLIERPDPDSDADYPRGMSWLRPAFGSVQNDDLMSAHKRKFFENAATPNMIIRSEKKLEKEQHDRLTRQFSRRHEGADNAYRTLLLEGATDAQVVGQNMQQMTFREVQDAEENRISMVSGVPAPVLGVVLGTSPTYNNFGTALRHFADSWARSRWRATAGSLAHLVGPPSDSRLWVDDRDVSALQQDADDAAAIRQKDAATIRTLVDAGFEPESVIAAVDADDMTLLEHSGNVSVQLIPAEPSAAAGDE